MKLSDAKIGLRVKFSKCYAKKCSQRFYEKYLGDSQYAPAVLYSIASNITTGIIIGHRSVIMSDYKLRGNSEDGTYITGKRETVLLVVKGIRNNPFIVRFCDVEWFGGADEI